MPLTIRDFPRDAEEQRVFDKAYSKGREWVMVAAMLLPALPFYPIWRPMRDTIGPEGAALLVIAAQFASILTVPDWVMSRRAHRALRLFRQTRSAPGAGGRRSAPQPEWSTASRHELRDGSILWIDAAGGKMWAGYATLPKPVEAEPDDIRKYHQIAAEVLDDPAFDGWATAMLHELQVLTAKTIMNHLRERTFFRDEAIGTIASRLFVYCRTRAGREAAENK